MLISDIAQSITSRLWPGYTAAVTAGGTVYLVSGSERVRQFTDSELQEICPEVCPELLVLGRGTPREEMFRAGAISERRAICDILPFAQ